MISFLLGMFIGAIAGCFWAGRRRDETYATETETEYNLPRDDAVERLLRRNREMMK